MVRIGLIGCGSFGAEHAQGFSVISEAQFAAFCDIDLTCAEAFVAKYQKGYATTDPAVVFSDASIDAIVICTHHDSHARLAVAALEARKHVLLEKPFALTEAECRNIAEAAARSDKVFMSGLKFRFYPAIEKAREHVPSPFFAIAQINDTFWPETFWGNDPVKGGGNVLSQGGHIMDLLCYLLRSEPTRIYAEGGNYLHPQRAIVDSAAATIRFASGATASVAISDSGVSPVVSKFSCQIFDGKHSAHLYNRFTSVALSDESGMREFHEENETGVVALDRHFIACIENGTKPLATAQDGLRATLMCLNTVTSIRSGKPIEMS